MQNKENILVIKLGALGDFIYALGPMRAIRQHHPNACITLLTTAPYQSIAQQCGYFDQIIIDKKPRWYQASKWLWLRQQFKDGNFTRVYDLQNNDRTEIYLSLFATIHQQSPLWFGAARKASHRNNSPTRTKYHAYYGHIDTLKLAGIETAPIDQLQWIHGKTPPISSTLTKPYILIVAGSSPNHPEKRWSAHYYAQLCAELVKKNYQCVLIGTHADKNQTDIIEQTTSGGIINLTGKTSMNDLPDLARNAVAAIGNDTGPMHIMAAAGCPSILLFCTESSTPEKHGPPVHTARCLAKKDINDISVEEILKTFETLKIK